MFSFPHAFSITMESFCLSFVFLFLKNFLHFAQIYLSHSDISQISWLPSLLRWKVVKCPLGTPQSPSQWTPILKLIIGHIYYESDLLLLCNHMQCGIVASLFHDVIKRNNNDYHNNNNNNNNNLIYLSLPTLFEAHTVCYGPSFFRWFMAHARRERPLKSTGKNWPRNWPIAARALTET